jgi:hypothetical protein
MSARRQPTPGAAHRAEHQEERQGRRGDPARLGRVDPKLLAPTTHRGAQTQADLAAVRARGAPIASRTLLLNHVRGAVNAVGARLPACDAHSFHSKARASLPSGLKGGLSSLIDAIEALTQIRAIDHLVLDLVSIRYPEARVLQQVAGVRH